MLDRADEGEQESQYDRRIKAVPRALRDHIPGSYLAPLIALHEKLVPPISEIAMTEPLSDGEEDPIIEIKEKNSPRTLFRRLRLFKSKRKRVVRHSNSN